MSTNPDEPRLATRCRTDEDRSTSPPNVELDGFEAAILAACADGPNCMDPQQLYTRLVRNISFIFEEGNTQEEVGERAAAMAVEVARIVLGENGEWTPQPAWNRPGIVDQFVAKEIGIPKHFPAQDIIEIAFLQCAHETMELALRKKNGEPAEIINPQFDVVVSRYALAFCGLPAANATPSSVEQPVPERG